MRYMETTNKVIKHPKSQMTSVTDNVVDERCVVRTDPSSRQYSLLSDCACTYTWA